MNNRSEIDTLRAELAEAKAELEAWRTYDRSVASDRTYDRARKLQESLNLYPPAACRLVVALYDARRAVSRDMLAELIPPVWRDERGNEPAFFSTLVCYARRALGRNAIHTHYGRGYELTPAGRERVAAILSETA